MWFLVGVVLLLAVIFVPAYVHDRRRKRLMTESLPWGHASPTDDHGYPMRMTYGNGAPSATGIWILGAQKGGGMGFAGGSSFVGGGYAGGGDGGGDGGC